MEILKDLYGLARQVDHLQPQGRCGLRRQYGPRRVVRMVALQDRQDPPGEGTEYNDGICVEAVVSQAPVQYAWLPDHTPNTSGGTAGITMELKPLLQFSNICFCRCRYLERQQQCLHALHHHQT
jgi:hypothetical protein